MNRTVFEVTETFQSVTEEERQENFRRLIEQYINAIMKKYDP